ncbi:condensation domain-containing protein [Kitasatospora sp. NBC_01246]|uniref:condensation domain-containing protein n=1 Tax=Kitasatospora sp. NBC_01246 TaxID=2903570 RepID=UPI002E2ECF5C|nr:condensation domain-containing protein [Kitasatospora sp. NBC_01246]
MNSDLGASGRPPEPDRANAPTNAPTTATTNAPTTSAPTATTSKEKALWLLEQLVPETGVNNLGLALQVSGRLRPDALRAALAIVVGRYEVLRTVYRTTGADLVKEVVPASGFAVEIEPLDLSGDPVERQLTAFADRPFRLDGRPLVRIGHAVRPDGDVLCVAVHHLVFDMVSVALFLQAFIPVYDAIAAGRPVPPQATAPAPALAEPEPRPADLAYWRETLEGFDPAGLELWCGTPRDRQPRLRGDTASRALSPGAQQAVLQLQRAVRAPLGAVMLAAYAALLAAHGAGPDLVIGSPVNVRGANTAAIGYHVNVVPIRIRVDLAEGFRALARQARDAFLGAMAHADTPVDELTGELPGIGTSWQTQLFRHLFNFLPEAPAGELSVGGMAARVLTVENPHSKFDLELVGSPSRAEIVFRHSETLAPAEVEAMLDRFDALLVAAAQDPDRPLAGTAGWSDADRRAVDRADGTAAPAVRPTVPAAFRAWAEKTPEAPAVTDGDHGVDYRQVDGAASAVRALLAGAGIGPGDTVAIAVPRREAAAAALGVWRAGAVCLPLDAGHDPSWLTRQLTHARAKAVLTGTGVRLPDDADLPPVLTSADAPAPGPAGPDADGEPTAPACVFYTCGEAGEPVATVLSHAGLADAVGHFAAELGVGPGTGVPTLAAPAGFDALFETFLALGAGGRCVVLPDGARTDATALRAAVDGLDATVAVVPPGTPARLLADPAGQLPGLTVLARGDELTAEVAERLLAGGCRLHSGLGIPGTTGWVLSGRVERPDGLTRGRPVAGTRAFVTAPDGRELPVGLRGELRLAGTAAAPSGPDGPAVATDARYGRHHRTGELARRRSDGAIEWLGRADRRVTTEDGPVDLGRVKADLLGRAGVTAAAALAVPRPDGGHTVVAFAETTTETATEASTDPTTEASTDPTTDPTTGTVADPAVAPGSATDTGAPAGSRLFVRLAALPRTPDGRPDHEALRALARKAVEQGADRPDPAEDDALVRSLVGIWGQLLSTDATAQTNFFDSGGHSLLAAVLAQRVEELTGRNLELADVFKHPTPAALAALLRA